MAGQLIDLETAQARVLALLDRGPVATFPLQSANKRWLAEPLVALRDQPSRDASAMDGYAVGQGPGPWRIVTSLPAEAANPAPLAADEAARIFTGAPLPPNAAGIVLQEDAIVRGAEVESRTPVVADRWIRRRASDFAIGTTLLPAGTRVTPGVVALAAMAGHAALPCHRTRAVTLLATGSELVPAGSAERGTPNTNNPMLAALFDGFAVTDRGVARDTLGALQQALRTFVDDNPEPALLVLSGGASVGDHDLVRPALEAEGWTIDLHRIAMKPGKPLIVAHRNGHLALGLPGNPVSAYVTALLFALPVLRKSGGCQDPLPQMCAAPLAGPLPAGGDRTEFLRGSRQLDGSVLAFAGQDSAELHVLARADTLIRIEAGSPPLDIGALVPTIAIG